MKLTYKASSKDGKIFQGSIEAKNTSEAAALLRRKNLIPITVKEEKENDLLSLFPVFRKRSSADLILFTRQLASMLASGLTLMQALQILRNQMRKSSMREIVSGIIGDIEEGKSLFQSIEKYPQVFSPVYVALIKAGESSGFLDKILERMANNLEKQQKLHSKIRSALLYPVIVVVLMMVVMSLMMILVVPQLTRLYTGIGISLPITTQIVIVISNFMIAFWPLLLILIAVIFVLFKKWSNTMFGRKVIDTVELRIPVFGKLISQSIIVEFSRTFGMLMGAGALVTTSLQETADITGNVVYKNAILDIANSVEKGIIIGNAMGAYAIFPPVLVEMVKIGEQTGKLDESLLKVSEYFEREVETTVRTLTTLLEPMIMVVLGLGVAFLILSIITPIYNLTSSIK